MALQFIGARPREKRLFPASSRGLIETGPRYLLYTLDATASIDPVFTAAALADADFVWYKPSGATFTGKAPAAANFNATGTYRVRCTNWALVTGLDFSGDAGLIGTNFDQVLQWMTGFTGNLWLYSTSLYDNVTNWNVSRVQRITVSTTNMQGSLEAWNTTTVQDIKVNSTSITGDVSVLNLSGILATRAFWAHSSLVTYESTGGAFTTLGQNAIPVRIDNCALPEVQVDNALVDCDSSGRTGGTIQANGTNAVPSATGLTAKTNLEAKGWTVTVSV